MEQVVAYKVIEIIKLKHLYLVCHVYCLSILNVLLIEKTNSLFLRKTLSKKTFASG